MGITSLSEPKTKQCPFCSETVQAPAIKCRYCAEFLNTKEAKALAAGSDPYDQDDDILFAASPSLWALTGSVMRGLLFLGAGVFLIIFPLEKLSFFELSDNAVLTFAEYRFIVGLGLVLLVPLILLIKVVQLKMTWYEVTAGRIEFSRGIFDRRVDNLDMFRVIDLKMRKSIFDCIVGIGTVGLITTDKTDPEFTFKKLRHPRQLYDIIKKASLDADRENRVIHLE